VQAAFAGKDGCGTAGAPSDHPKISNNSVEEAVGKFYDTDITNLRTLLRNSEAKWDETAFGGAAYGNDATLPSTSARTQQVDDGRHELTAFLLSFQY
jgi:hypothetical protein